jgi:hypothetical protein
MKKNSNQNGPGSTLHLKSLSLLSVIRHRWRSLGRALKLACSFIRRDFRALQPLIALSPEGMQDPLPEGWLKSTRDFITRSGLRENHPASFKEVLITGPAAGIILDPDLIGGSDLPFFSSVGFGDFSFGLDEFTCGSNTCGDQDMTHPKCPNNSCDWNSCGNQSCGIYRCEENTCDKHGCGENKCTKQKGIVDCITDLEANWNHPFVQDLITHFHEADYTELAAAVHRFVCNNGLDLSVLNRNRDTEHRPD